MYVFSPDLSDCSITLINANIPATTLLVSSVVGFLAASCRVLDSIPACDWVTVRRLLDSCFSHLDLIALLAS